jgi:UDP-N-acetylglucosamine:LPS N-acetylglucosamine transferase
MPNKKTLKICLAASAGGHLSQLLKIAPVGQGHQIFCLTTKEEIRAKLEPFGPVTVVGECNREHPLKVAKVLSRCIRTVFREKPDLVISSGAAVGCIACFLGKLLGAKIIWIDSITNIERLSLSGRMVRTIADLFLVQWPELAQKYSNVEYAGEVI